MNAVTTALDESESARQGYLEQLEADGEPQAQFTPGSYGCHELLDRTSLLMGNVEEHLLRHPACVQNKEWFALAYQAVQRLNELYQTIGAAHVEKTNGD